MLRFILIRLIYLVPILFGVSLVTFALLFLQPGNPVEALLPMEAPHEVVEFMKRQLGLDQPFYVQYLKWLWRTLHGDLGLALYDGMPVMEQIMSGLQNTLILAVPAAIISFSTGTLLGILSACRPDGISDRIATALAIMSVSVPQYWIAIVLVVFFSVSYNLLPAAGMGNEGGLPMSFEELSYMIMPIVAMALAPVGVIARVVRASVMDVLALDFIHALRAKGLSDGRVLRHVLRNATASALAVMGMQFGYLIGGSILVETVFNWPGTGQLLNLAIFRRDIPVLQGTIIVTATLFVLTNLTVDILQALIDPRMRR